MKAPGPYPGACESRAGTDDEAQLPALGWMRRAHAQDELLQEVDRQIKLRRRRRWLGTAAAAAIILGGGLYWHAPTVNSPQPSPKVATATVLRPERQRLPDGSVVELREGAKIAFDFEGPLRRVILRNGEAYFAVAANPLRPFVVEAGAASVRAVGTAFSVHVARQQIEVVVAEGQVAVSSPSAPPSRIISSPPPALVSAGNRCVLPSAARPDIQPVSPAELLARLSWRIPQLEFSRTLLTEVVALMNEHHPRSVRFVLGDSDLNKVCLSGFLRADNDEGLVGLLETQFAVRAERVGDTITLRTKR